MNKQAPCNKQPYTQISILSKQKNYLNRFITNLTAGIICGEIIVIYAISFAALIFSGDLSTHISTGVGLALFTAMAASLVTAFMSSLPGVVIMPQDAPAVILGLMASAIVVQMPDSATSTDILYTVITAISFTSILAAIVRSELSGYNAVGTQVFIVGMGFNQSWV